MNFDYIIIGAGVIGSSTAYYLKKALPEKRILLIDRNRTAGAGNTAKSAALYRNFFSSRTNRMLAASSIRYYIELGGKIGLDPIGYLWLFSEEQWKNSQKSIRQLDMKKDEFEVLDRAGIANILRINFQSKNPFADVHAGIYCHLCGSLSAMALARHYASEFVSLGGEVSFDTDIRSFILTGQISSYAPWEDVHIDTVMDQKGNSYYAANYVIATGAWTHDLLAPVGIASGILPKKRQLFALKIDEHAQLIEHPGKAPAIILPAGGVYIKPILERNILIVGSADDLGQPFMMSDPEPDPRYFHNAIEPVLNHYFPQLAGYNLSLKWAGYYDYHWPDMTPVIESVANITWIGGTSGSGIMKADAIGRIAAAGLQGHKEAFLADGARFEISKLSLRDRDVEKEELII